MGVIPNTVHRIWFGPHPMRRELIEYGRSWERHGYDLKLWTEKNLPELVNQEIYDLITPETAHAGGGDQHLAQWVQRADIVGYELVYRFGGIYANTDMECLRSLDDVLDGVTAFAARESDREHHYLCNALMGATPEHPFFAAVLEALPQRWWDMRGEPMNVVTGPHLLTQVREERDDLTAFPSAWFYPFTFLEMDSEWDEYPDAYTRHHWGHTRDRWSVEPGAEHWQQ